MPTDSTTVAATSPMIRTTTISSMSVNPAECVYRPARLLLLVFSIPVTDVGVRPFAAGLVVCAHRIEIEFAAMRAGHDVLIIEAPRILADALDVAPRPP